LPAPPGRRQLASRARGRWATHATAMPSVSAPGWRTRAQAAPGLAGGFTRKTFTAMIEGVREAATGAGPGWEGSFAGLGGKRVGAEIGGSAGKPGGFGVSAARGGRGPLARVDAMAAAAWSCPAPASSSTPRTTPTSRARCVISQADERFPERDTFAGSIADHPAEGGRVLTGGDRLLEPARIRQDHAEVVQRHALVVPWLGRLLTGSGRAGLWVAGISGSAPVRRDPAIEGAAETRARRLERTRNRSWR
jgi:hypothetical protein